MAEYSPPIGDAVILNLLPWVEVPGDAIILELVPPDPVIVTPLLSTPDFDCPWSENEQLNTLLGAGWRDRRFVTRSFSTAHQTLRTSDVEKQAGWDDKRWYDSIKKTNWRDRKGDDSSVGILWLNPKGNDRVVMLRLGQLKKIEYQYRLSYGNPPACERHYNILLKPRKLKEISHRSPWIGKLPVKDVLHRTVWGPKYYAEICYRKYKIPHGLDVMLDLNLPITHVGDGLNVALYFDPYAYDRRCTWRERSGWRDAYFYIKPIPAPTGLYAKVYTMLNTASLTRLPDRQAIDVSSITVSTDWDSVYWSVKASIGSDAHLAMLESTVDGPILIETAINGHIWNLQVDSWGTGRAFGSKSRSISGRSVSAQLGAPAAELRTKTETEQRLASQLMNAELENTGWTAVIVGDDWLVPGNTFSYADQTPMQIIKTIADAVGATVYTDKVTKTITVKPRYIVPPWQWASTAAGIIIPSSMAEKVDGEWDERPFYNAAFVSGEANGISAKVTREGSAGDLIAPMITDGLITAPEAARARGISILAASGKWSKYRVELPVFPSPTVPGVILPGTILQFVDGMITWKGIVTSVSVSANRGTEGLKVRQSIDVERYHGN